MGSGAYPINQIGPVKVEKYLLFHSQTTRQAVSGRRRGGAGIPRTASLSENKELVSPH